ncbi:MAG: hypothetical protein BWZ00_00034 [Bacteroidetes bacterium ADurb.BinA174]|nr:MAG: hypothetical protein BWZ00_00034 [Bacteroidetes bacterium ADurb.BinA174]
MYLKGFYETFSEHFFREEMRTTKKYKLNGRPSPRTKKAEFMLSDEEYEVINFYLKKYKITNRSRWFRETIMNQILKNMNMDYPTLFEENEMRR